MGRKSRTRFNRSPARHARHFRMPAWFGGLSGIVRARGPFFARELFGDPAWDILLDLAAAQVEHTRVSVTSLCIRQRSAAQYRPQVDQASDRGRPARTDGGRHRPAPRLRAAFRQCSRCNGALFRRCRAGCRAIDLIVSSRHQVGTWPAASRSRDGGDSAPLRTRDSLRLPAGSGCRMSSSGRSR